MSENARTPLYDWHKNHGGRIVPFAGWELPVQYSGLREEHTAVREAAGLFDVSHMGEIRVSGPKALETLQWISTNDVAKLKKNEAQYSLFPNSEGGVVDDLIVYCLEPHSEYLLCVNAANSQKDFAYVVANNRGANITDESGRWGQVALQGPKALSILNATMKLHASPAVVEQLGALEAFTILPLTWNNIDLIVAKTGYTGEDGVEIFVPWESTLILWENLIAVGAPMGLLPCGLGARDTLRTEVKYPLYGHEIDDVTNPYSAGLGWVIKPKNKDFLGKAELLRQKEVGLKQKLVGLTLEDKGIARQGYGVFSFDNKEIGRVTSGTLSPTLNIAIAIAYVDVEMSEINQTVFVDVRGKKLKARVVKTPFVTKTGEK